MRRTLFVAFLCSLAVCTSAFAGSISGTITYDDKAPPPKRLKMDADPVCASKHSEPVYSERLVLGDGGTVGNIFVSIKNPPAGSHTAPSEAAVIDQNGCVYHPHVVGVMVGQPLKFKNSDGILHNVHGLPKENREFNIGMPPTLKEKDQVFNKPEPLFPVKCDVHPWMNAFVAVMTHPYFSVTAADGKYSIDNVPDGTYEVEAWHEKLPPVSGKVTVSGGDATLDLTLKLPARK